LDFSRTGEALLESYACELAKLLLLLLCLMLPGSLLLRATWGPRGKLERERVVDGFVLESHSGSLLAMGIGGTVGEMARLEVLESELDTVFKRLR